MDAMSILRLPPELMVIIFETCFAPSSRDPWPDRTWLLFLAHVCRRWRNIAISTPQLWTDIAMKENVSLLKNIWIPRSGALPLHINLTLQERDDDGYGVADDGQARALLDALVPVADRWQRVYLDAPSRFIEYCSSYELSLPLLESLQVDGIQGAASRKDLTAFENAPQLRDFTGFGYSVWLLHLPWSGLRFLTLQMQIVEDFMYMLSWCRSLQFAQASLRPFDDEYRIPVQHSQLDTLILESLEGNSGDLVFPNTLSALTLPALTTLALANDRGTEIWDQPAFLDFLSRSQCDLQSLTLTAMEIKEEDLLECLSAMPLLDSLSLVDVFDCTGQTFFTRMTLASVDDDARTPVIAPSLSNFLLCVVQHSQELHCKTLVEMVQSRLRSTGAGGRATDILPARLKRLTLRVENETVLDRLTVHFDSWRAGGLDVQTSLD